MAISAVGEWVGSALIGKLVDKVCCYAGNQYEYQRDGMKDELRTMAENLKRVRAAVHFAEMTQIKSPSLAEWLKDIKDAAYDADDILDTFDYRVLEDKVRRVSHSSSSDNFTAKRARRALEGFLFSDRDLNALTEVARRFKRIAKEMLAFLKLVEFEAGATKQHEPKLDWRKTTSMPNEHDVFGRANEEEYLKKLLLKTDDSEGGESGYSVLSIVGMGGVGKTTLAQSAYNDQSVVDHFDLMVWIYVSEKFDVERLTVEMIQSASCSEENKDLPNMRNFDKIQQILKEKVTMKRFLLVLDDVWNVVSSQWRTLCKPFRFAKKGSRIVITTRDRNVAELMEARETINLKGLEDEDCWMFFEQCAFGDTNPTEHPKLKSIGRCIAKKLGGSPLAAKTVGGVLKLKLEEDHWREVLESRLWQVEQKEDGIIPALKLSYEHLPKHLKQCFVYFALFPKDNRFHKEKLVQIWMAQGFIRSGHGQKRIEDVGADYIDELLSRSFIQYAVGSENQYVIHDLLHDLAESVSNGEYFRIERDLSVQIPRNVRHLFVNASSMITAFENAAEMKNLRSLVVFRDLAASAGGFLLNFVHVFQETLKELKGLRVLILHHLQDILPEPIDHLIHLRYLDIQSSSVKELPKSLSRLYHLQAMNLQVGYPHNLQRTLLKDMNNLINLRYLYSDSNAISTIDGIGRLTSLQELKEYHLKNNDEYDLGQLKDMKQLRGQLCIKNLENARSLTESRKAEMDGKEHLNKLSLCWSTVKEEEIKHSEHEEVLEGLQPHRNLRELHITRYKGIKSPSWLDSTYVSNLDHLELSHCDRWTTLPPLGQLPFLRILQLRSLKAVNLIGTEFYGESDVAFPFLEVLTFEDMVEWKKWLGVERIAFPRLSKLRIIGCPRLKGVLPLVSLPRGIKIRLLKRHYSYAPDMRLIKKNKETSSAIELMLDRVWFLFTCLPALSFGSVCGLEVSCYFVKSFNAEQEEWFRRLTSLEQLLFRDCQLLQSLPSTLECLSSLETLELEKCPLLESLPDTGLPLTLKKLSITKCHNALKRGCDSRTGLHWPKISHIPTIIIDKKDVRDRGN